MVKHAKKGAARLQQSLQTHVWPCADSTAASANQYDVQLFDTTRIYVQIIDTQDHVDPTLLKAANNIWIHALKVLQQDQTFHLGVTKLQHELMAVHTKIQDIKTRYDTQMKEARRLVPSLITTNISTWLMNPVAASEANLLLLTAEIDLLVGYQAQLATAQQMIDEVKADPILLPLVPLSTTFHRTWFVRPVADKLTAFKASTKILADQMALCRTSYPTFLNLNQQLLTLEYPSTALKRERDTTWANLTFANTSQRLLALEVFIGRVKSDLTQVNQQRVDLHQKWQDLGSLSPHEEKEHKTMVDQTASLTLLADRMPDLVRTLERIRVCRQARVLIEATNNKPWTMALYSRRTLQDQLRTSTNATLVTLQHSVDQLKSEVPTVEHLYSQYETRVQALNNLKCPSPSMQVERDSRITTYNLVDLGNVNAGAAIDAFIIQVNDRVKTLQARQSAIETEYKALKPITPLTDTAKKLEAELLIHTIPDLEARVAQLEALLTTVRKEVQQQQTPTVDHQREQLALQLYQSTLDKRFPEVFKRRANPFAPTAFTDATQPNQKAVTLLSSVYVPIPLVVRREIAAHLFYRSFILLDIPLAPAAGQSIVVALRHIFQDPALIKTGDFDRYQPMGIMDRLTGLFVAPPRMYTLEQATHILSNHHNVNIFQVTNLADDDNDNDTLLGLLVQGPSHVYAILRFKQVWIQVDTVSVAEGGARHPLVLATKEIQDLVAKSIPVWAVAVSPSAFWQQPTLTNPHAIPWVRAEAQIPPVITTNLPQLPNILATMLKETQQK